MLKKLMICMVFLCAVSTISYSQQKFTVLGEVKFQKRKGIIILALETYDEFEKSELVPPERMLMIKLDAQQLTAEKVPFKFVGVLKGTYAISCIQDLNENGEMDYIDSALGVKHPAEQDGFSGSTILGGVNWNSVKFEVDKDINGIEIDVCSF